MADGGGVVDEGVTQTWGGGHNQVGVADEGEVGRQQEGVGAGVTVEGGDVQHSATEQVTKAAGEEGGVSGHHDDDDDDAWLSATWWLWMVGAPTLIVLGTVGNVMSAVIMQRITSKDLQAHGIFLTALAVSDTVALLVGVGNMWSQRIMKLDVLTLHTALCKIGMLVIPSSITISAWLAVSVSVVRVVAVVWPHKVSILIGRKQAWVIIFTIIVIIGLIEAHFPYGFILITPPVGGPVDQGVDNETSTVVTATDALFTMGSEVTQTPVAMMTWWPGQSTETSDVDVSTSGQVSEAEMIFPSTFCVPRAGAYADFLETVVVFIDGSLTSVLPFCIILMCNIVLSLSLRQAYRKIRQRMSTAGMSNQRSRRDEKMTSTILTVLTISTMFLVLTLPWKTTKMVMGMMGLNYIHGRYGNAFTFYYDLVTFLYFANNGVNSYIYCLTGSNFRTATKDALCCRGSKRPASSSMRRNTSSNQFKKGKPTVFGSARHSSGREASSATAVSDVKISISQSDNYAGAPGTKVSLSTTGDNKGGNVATVCGGIKQVEMDNDAYVRDESE
jgi:hypothetical protein